MLLRNPVISGLFGYLLQPCLELVNNTLKIKAGALRNSILAQQKEKMQTEKKKKNSLKI